MEGVVQWIVVCHQLADVQSAGLPHVHLFKQQHVSDNPLIVFALRVLMYFLNLVLRCAPKAGYCVSIILSRYDICV